MSLLYTKVFTPKVLKALISDYDVHSDVSNLFPSFTEHFSLKIVTILCAVVPQSNTNTCSMDFLHDYIFTTNMASFGNIFKTFFLCFFIKLFMEAIPN